MRHQFISEEQFKVIQKRVGIGKHTTTSLIVKDIVPKRRSVNNPASSPYKSKLERSWANYLHGLWMLKAVKQYWYEPFSIWLPGKVRFKPDFLVWTSDGLTIYEVKGYSPNRRDGITRLKVAAALFPCFTWVLVTREKGQWNETRIG